MRPCLAIVLLLAAAPSGADSLGLSIGARVVGRCSAHPTASAPRLRCLATPASGARYEFVRRAGATVLTILL